MARELLLIALVAGAGCARCSKSGPEPTGTPLASKPFYRVDPGPQTACASGAVCEARLVLTALGDYHVNKEYPFKFIAAPAPALPVDGTGTFALDDARHGTLTIRFRPSTAGSAKLIGDFKLSVCSDDACEIETPRLELTIP